jgi:hypothetical protein
VLYVLGDETVSDFSSLDVMVSSGKITKVDLKEKNDFRIRFQLFEWGSFNCFIMMDEVESRDTFVGFSSGQAVIGNMMVDGEIFAVYYLPDTLKNQSVVG